MQNVANEYFIPKDKRVPFVFSFNIIFHSLLWCRDGRYSYGSPTPEREGIERVSV